MPDPKINAKNLSYSSDLPPFLRALHAQSSGVSSEGPDPILAKRRRAAKKRSSSEEAEDQPLVVDEDGNVVEEAGDVDDDGNVRAKAGSKDEGGNHEDSTTDAAVQTRREEKLADIGITRKRKVGRVIGGGDDEQDQEQEKMKDDEKPGKTPKPESNKGALENDQAPDSSRLAEGNKPKTKKKAKKIKLSFDPE